MIAAVILAITVYIIPSVYFLKKGDEASAFVWGMGGIFASFAVLIIAAKVIGI